MAQKAPVLPFPLRTHRNARFHRPRKPLCHTLRPSGHMPGLRLIPEDRNITGYASVIFALTEISFNLPMPDSFPVHPVGRVCSGLSLQDPGGEGRTGAFCAMEMRPASRRASARRKASRAHRNARHNRLRILPSPPGPCSDRPEHTRLTG